MFKILSTSPCTDASMISNMSWRLTFSLLMTVRLMKVSLGEGGHLSLAGRSDVW